MKNVALLSAVFALSGCGFDKAPPTQAETGHTPKPVPAIQTKTGDPGSRLAQADADRLERFADALVATGKGHFRFDRIRDAKNGGQERQVFVEMLGLTDDEAALAAAKALESLGYEPGNQTEDRKGLKMSYRYRNEEPLRVWVRSREVHAKLKHEQATSSVYVTQPLVE